MTPQTAPLPLGGGRVGSGVSASTGASSTLSPVTTGASSTGASAGAGAGAGGAGSWARAKGAHKRRPSTTAIEVHVHDARMSVSPFSVEERMRSGWLRLADDLVGQDRDRLRATLTCDVHGLDGERVRRIVGGIEVNDFVGARGHHARDLVFELGLVDGRSVDLEGAFLLHGEDDALVLRRWLGHLLRVLLRDLHPELLRQERRDDH